jgi:hypothetical protein
MRFIFGIHVAEEKRFVRKYVAVAVLRTLKYSLVDLFVNKSFQAGLIDD